MPCLRTQFAVASTSQLCDDRACMLYNVCFSGQVLYRITQSPNPKTKWNGKAGFETTYGPSPGSSSEIDRKLSGD